MLPMHPVRRVGSRVNRLIIVGSLACAGCTGSREPSPTSRQASAPPSAAPSATAVGSANATPVASASAQSAPKPPEPTWSAGRLPEGGSKAVSSERGMVTSVEPNATRAGIAVLEAGGNAVDAAVAAGYALAVTHPSAGNLGGGGFMLIKKPGEPAVAIDFRERAPAALTLKAFNKMIEDKAIGPAASGVPGTVAGFNLAQRKYGKLSLTKVLAPAIKLARDGHRIGQREALTIGWNWHRLKRNAETRRVFGRSATKPKRRGTRLRRPDLAKTLRLIAEHGDAGFYEGPVADRIAAAMKPDGLITKADLKNYQAKLRKPISLMYRGFQVEIMPPPSAGGVAVAAALSMLQAAEAYKHPRFSAEYLHTLIEVAKRAHAVRRFGVGDPDTSRTDTPERRSEWVNGKRWLAMQPIDKTRATPAAELTTLYKAVARESQNTTHLSVVDKNGLAVTLTTTLSAGFGAKYIVPGTGIVMNNTVAGFGGVGDNQPKPGRRITSSMSPTLVSRRHQPELLLGSPGGDTIANTVVQVLVNLIDFGMPLDRAVNAARVHHGYTPDAFRYERARPIPKPVIEALKKLGHEVSKKRIPIGDANNILIRDGRFYGVADQREGGLAAAPSK